MGTTNSSDCNNTCRVCDKGIEKRQHILQCTSCAIVVHRTCLPSMKQEEFTKLKENWKCLRCCNKKTPSPPGRGDVNVKIRQREAGRKEQVSPGVTKVKARQATGNSNCCVCSRDIEVGQHTLQCSTCSNFAHRTCFGKLSPADFARFKASWTCRHCEHLKHVGRKGATGVNKVGFEITLQDEAVESPKVDKDQVVVLFPKGVRFAHLNVNGIKGKRDEIKDFLRKQKDLLCFAITESKLTSVDKIEDLDLLIPGYSLFRGDRGWGQQGGGQLIFIKSCCTFEEVELNDVPPGLVECTILRVRTTGIPTTVLCVLYVPPQDTKADFFEFFHTLCKFLRSNRRTAGRRLVITGDINVNWRYETRTQQKLEKVCQEFALKQIVNEGTRKGAILDHIYTDKGVEVRAKVADLTNSDHKLISVRFK